MAATSAVIWLGLAALSAMLSYGVLWLIARPAAAIRTMAARDDTADEACFLFQDDVMFDSHSGVLPPSAEDAPTWAELRSWLAARFDNLPVSLADLAEDESLSVPASGEDDAARVSLRRTHHGTRVTLSDPSHRHPAERHEMLMARARLDDAAKALQAAPFPVWKTAPDGQVLWRNSACDGAFDPQEQALDIPTQGHSTTCRFSATPKVGGRPIWYEVHSTSVRTEVFHSATDITKVVRAERMQKDFVQTLTKTFAYLTTGLAVFDKERKLALFNPALVDLTSLPAEFLSGQPCLMAFFDKLRDRRVMPEPRSYASWRTQIGQVIESAEGGLYQETWCLPNDVTYRVTGRPHPDGAIAFLFEDITADIMMARGFRQQIDLRQSALDRLPEAVMVIGADNVLSFCNRSAADLLRIDPDNCFADMSVADLVRACASALPDPELWPEIEAELTRRSPADARRSIAATQGCQMSCRIQPLPGGARMLILHEDTDAVPVPPAAMKAG